MPESPNGEGFFRQHLFRKRRGFIPNVKSPLLGNPKICRLVGYPLGKPFVRGILWRVYKILSEHPEGFRLYANGMAVSVLPAARDVLGRKEGLRGKLRVPRMDYNEAFDYAIRDLTKNSKTYLADFKAH